MVPYSMESNNTFENQKKKAQGSSDYKPSVNTTNASGKKKANVAGYNPYNPSSIITNSKTKNPGINTNAVNSQGTAGQSNSNINRKATPNNSNYSRVKPQESKQHSDRNIDNQQHLE